MKNYFKLKIRSVTLICICFALFFSFLMSNQKFKQSVETAQAQTQSYTCTVNMNAAKTVTATFNSSVPNQAPIAVAGISTTTSANVSCPVNSDPDPVFRSSCINPGQDKTFTNMYGGVENKYFTKIATENVNFLYLTLYGNIDANADCSLELPDGRLFTGQILGDSGSCSIRVVSQDFTNGPKPPPASSACSALPLPESQISIQPNIPDQYLPRGYYTLKIKQKVAETDALCQWGTVSSGMSSIGFYEPSGAAIPPCNIGLPPSSSITVKKGIPTPIYLSASGSSDPNGWTDAVNGVSTDPGKCEWNSDLNQGDPTFEPASTVNHPTSPSACNISLGSKIFNDNPGTYTYQVLRITDKPGKQSNIGSVSVTVQPLVLKYKCSDTACVQDSTGAYTTSNCDNKCFTCQGALPDAATLCEGDDTGLTNNTTYYSAVATCTAGKKCEYRIACAGKCSTIYKYAYVNPYYSSTSDCMNPVGELVHTEKCTCTQGANTTRYPKFVTNCVPGSPTLTCSPSSSSIEIGDDQQLEAMYDQDGSETKYAPKEVDASWKIKSGTTATVNSAGLVTAGKSAGNNVVEAKYDGLTADCNVTLTPNYAPTYRRSY